ncbi:hypothetical protein NDU88_006588 [Pleurodeles waltl]|uniref:Uncharacterized protein n=1 Tax=Pleurodeles waltl TaxID=8319 RepID=A0AAV7UMK3_PLEWA|nr:hypothetical protein NDU88_006588 [Pleurodeles waltl]
MDVGRHGSRSPRGLFSRLLAAAGSPSPVFRRRDSAPFCQALSAWGESRVLCLTSRSCGVPGHDFVSPLLWGWGWGGSGPGVLFGCLLAPVAPPGSSRHGALALSGHLVSWPGHAPPISEC